MIIEIANTQDRGKTLTAIITIHELIARHGYAWSDVIANIRLAPGGTYLPNSKITDYLRHIAANQVRHKIILLDEADQLFPARDWTNQHQTRSLIGLWQDRKLFLWLIYTSHIGTGVDKVLRDITNICLIPSYQRSTDTIRIKIINGLQCRTAYTTLKHASTYFPTYNRWDSVL